MPNEYVYSKSGKFDFQITWDAEEGRGPDIQVGISTRHGEKTLAEAFAPESDEVDARPHTEKPQDVDAGKFEPFEHYRGVYGQFDRASINRMIRLLRKARDHVYGRDE